MNGVRPRTQNKADGDALRDVYRRCRSSVPEVAPAGRSGEPGNDSDRIRRRLHEIRAQRRALLGAKTVAAVRQAADGIHGDAATLCGWLDNSIDRATWPVIYTNPEDQQRVLDRVEKRLLDAVRWSAYVLRLADGQSADGDDLHPLIPEAADGGRSDESAARLIDAQISLAREAGRLLSLLDREGAPGA
jgi:hypothetical protein